MVLSLPLKIRRLPPFVSQPFGVCFFSAGNRFSLTPDCFVRNLTIEPIDRRSHVQNSHLQTGGSFIR